MDKKYEIGNFICRLRNEKGYTQKELGVLLGVTDKAVSKWENGAALPRREVLRHLAAVLGCTQEELLQGRRIQKAEAADPDPYEIARETEIGMTSGQSGVLTTEEKKIKAIIWKTELCVLAVLAVLCFVFGFQKGIWNGTKFFRAHTENGQCVYSGRGDDSVQISTEGEQNILEILSKEGQSARLRFRITESGEAQSLTILSADGVPILSRCYYKQAEDHSAWQNDYLIAEQIWNTDGWYPGLPDQTICRMTLRLEQTRLRGRAEDCFTALAFVAMGFLICFFMEALIKLDIWFLRFFYKHTDNLRASRLMQGIIALSGILIFTGGLILFGSILLG